MTPPAREENEETTILRTGKMISLIPLPPTANRIAPPGSSAEHERDIRDNEEQGTDFTAAKNTTATNSTEKIVPTSEQTRKTSREPEDPYQK